MPSVDLAKVWSWSHWVVDTKERFCVTREREILVQNALSPVLNSSAVGISVLTGKQVILYYLYFHLAMYIIISYYLLPSYNTYMHSITLILIYYYELCARTFRPHQVCWKIFLTLSTSSLARIFFVFVRFIPPLISVIEFVVLSSNTNRMYCYNRN